MSDPLSTLAELNYLTLQLAQAQARIDIARSAFPADGSFQLEMDRRQTEVDKRRRVIEVIKFDIATRN